MRNKAVKRWQWTLCEAYTFHPANIHTFAIINILHKHCTQIQVSPRCVQRAQQIWPNDGHWKERCAQVASQCWLAIHSVCVYIPNVNLFSSIFFSRRCHFKNKMYIYKNCGVRAARIGITLEWRVYVIFPSFLSRYFAFAGIFCFIFLSFFMGRVYTLTLCRSHAHITENTFVAHAS